MHIVYLTPDFLLAIVSCWLGLSLFVRAPRDRLARAFGWFCLHLTLYGLTSLLPQITTSAEAARLFDRLNIVETMLLPPVFIQFILALTIPGRPTTSQRTILWISYASGLALAAYALFGTIMPAVYPGTPAAPYRPWTIWGEASMPSGLLNWLWIAQRVVPTSYAIWLLWQSFRAAPLDSEDRRLRRIFFLTAFIGLLGVAAVVLARIFDLPASLGRGVITGAMVGLAYAVLAYRALLPARVAQRTFFYSILGSMITTLYVGLLFALESVAHNWLNITAPVVSIFMLVILVAALGPLREWARARLDQRFYRREFDYGQLLASIGDELRDWGDLPEQLQAALASICRTLGVESGLVAVRPAGLPDDDATPEMTIQATYGARLPLADSLVKMVLPAGPETLAAEAHGYSLLLPLRRAGHGLGLLALGPKRSGQPFSATERTLLASLGTYLASVLSYAQASQQQQAVLSKLAEESRALEAQREALAQQASATAVQTTAPALVTDASAELDNRLWVYALGELYVERNGERISRWGGEKAGTYQAEAVFAFLFDRLSLGRGMGKDEAEEVIWPDEENIKKADDAFHRTLGALRRTLEPGLSRASDSRAIRYHHERYWLDPGLIAWADVDAFGAAAEQGRTLLRQGDHEGALAQLREATRLYRADYMDAAPFFGDSHYAEERRSELRVQYVEVLLALGSAYEVLGQVGEASTTYHRALSKSEECSNAAATLQARAQQGLERLQSKL